MQSSASYAPTVPLASGMGTILLPQTSETLPTGGGDLWGAWRVPRRLGELAVTCAEPRTLPWQRAPQTAEQRLQAAQRVQQMAISLCKTQGVQMDVQGVVPDQTVIVVANHVSYVDTLVIPALLPTTCVAKKEVLAWPGVGALAMRMGTLFVERGNSQSGAVALRQAARALDAGVSVVAFPEGTTSPGDRLLPFHRGIFGLAILRNVPVLPVTLVYSDPRVAWVGEAPFLNHYLKRVASKRRTHVTVRLAPLLAPSLFQNARDLARATQQVMAKAMRQSLP